MRKFICLLLLFPLIGFVKAQKITVSDIYKDSTKIYTVGNIEKDSIDWITITISDHPENEPGYIEFGDMGKVMLYRGNKHIGKTGKSLAVSEKAYPSSRNIIPVHKSGTYLAKLQSTYPLFEPANFEIKYHSLSELRQLENQRLITQGFFFGLIIVMSLYNLMIFFSVKDRSYLYYVLSILGLGLYLFFFYGFTIELLWPESPRWDIHFFALIVPLTNISRILFTRSYLNTADHVPSWDRFFNLLMIVYLVPLGLWAGSYLGLFSMLQEAKMVIGILGTTVLMSITVISVIVYLNGYKPALWFMIAYFLFNLGGILFIFKEFGYLPDNFFIRYLLQFGAAVQVILFSLGLADRLNRTRQKLSREILEKERIAREREIEKNKKVIVQKEELEKKVKERTKELEELLGQITDSEKKLRELNQIKDRLFSIISHDLKNPLTTVDSFLNLLIDHHDKLSKKDMNELSHKTKFAIQNLILLLENLLQWSRTQQNYVSFNPIQLDIMPSLQKVTKLFRLLTEEKNIDVQMVLHSSHVYAFGDKDMFEFVLRNLVHNAIKFTPKNGHIRIEIIEQNEYLKIMVTDSGIGMKQIEIDRIQTLGENFTSAGTEKEKGTGIGLLMCKDFIERNGGELYIEKKDPGTCVSFLIPSYTVASIA